MRLSYRGSALAALLVLECLALSTWLDTQALEDRQGIAAAIGNWGPSLARMALAFTLTLVIQLANGAKNLPASLAAQLSESSLSWRALAGHVGVIAGFCVLSSLFFDGSHSGAHGPWLTSAWLICGIVAFVLALMTVIPAEFWLRLFRWGRRSCFYAAALAPAVLALSYMGKRLWKPAAELTFACVRVVLTPLLPGVYASRETMDIGTSRFSVSISPECSGLEGVALVLTFGAGWLLFFRRDYRFPQGLLLLPTSACAVWILNVFRIATLILIGNAGAAGIALGGFHSQAGWIGFSCVALGLAAGSNRIGWLMRAPAGRASARNPATPYLLPFMAIVAATMVSRAFSDGSFERLYPLRLIGAAAVCCYFRSEYKQLGWRLDWRACGIGAAVFALWIAFEPLAATTSSAAFAAALQSLGVAGRSAWLAARVVSAVVAVPIAEEFAFRGFLLRRLVASDFESVDPRHYTVIALIGSSLLFGLLHGSRWPAGTIAGVLYALVYARRGRLADAIVAHGMTNALLAGWILWRGEWGLW